MDCTIGGQRCRLTRKGIEARMEGVEPENVRCHGVRIGRRLYPVKQVIARSAGVSKADFNSHEARRVLRQLGFALVQLKITV